MGILYSLTFEWIGVIIEKSMKGRANMGYENEKIIQKLIDLIIDGVSDESLMDSGFTSEQIEAAHINYLALYF